MDNEKNTELGTMPVGRLMFKLALPAIVAQVINALYNIVDRMYIGHIEGVGPMALTGVGITFPIIMLITAFAAMIGMGGAPLAAIHLGEKNRDSAEGILGNAATLLLILSVVLTAFFLIFQRPLLMAFGASENTIEHALQYMTIYLCGTIFVMATLGLNSFNTGLCENRYADCTYRRSTEYYSGSGFYFCVWHGRPGRRTGNHSFTGCFGYLGLSVFDGQKNHHQN